MSCLLPPAWHRGFPRRTFFANAVCQIMGEPSNGPEQIVTELRENFGARIIALTMVDGGSICIDEKAVYGEWPYPAVVEVDRVGAGDAFASGFLFGYLEGNDLAQCLRYARALSAIKYSIPGDLAITTREELESLVSRSPQEGIQR